MRRLLAIALIALALAVVCLRLNWTPYVKTPGTAHPPTQRSRLAAAPPLEHSQSSDERQLLLSGANVDVDLIICAPGNVSLQGYPLTVRLADGRTQPIVVGRDGRTHIHGAAHPITILGDDFLEAHVPPSSTSVELTPKQRFLRVDIWGAGILDGLIKAWVAEDGKPLGVKPVHPDGENAFAFFSLPTETRRVDVGARGMGLSIQSASKIAFSGGPAAQCSLYVSPECTLSIELERTAAPLLDGRTVSLYYSSFRFPDLPRPPLPIYSTLTEGKARFIALPDGACRLSVTSDFGGAIPLRTSEGSLAWTACAGSAALTAYTDEPIAEVVIKGRGFDASTPYSMSLDSLPGIGPTTWGPAIGSEVALLGATRIGIAFAGGEFLLEPEALHESSPHRYTLELPDGTQELIARASGPTSLGLRATNHATRSRHESALQEDGTWRFHLPVGTYALELSWADGYCHRFVANVEILPDADQAIDIEVPQPAELPGSFVSWDSIPPALRPAEIQVECSSAPVAPDGTFTLSFLSPLPSFGNVDLHGGQRFLSNVALDVLPPGRIEAELRWQDLCLYEITADPIRGGKVFAELLPKELSKPSCFDYRIQIAPRAKTVGSIAQLVAPCTDPITGCIVEYAGGRRLLSGWFYGRGNKEPPLVETAGRWGTITRDLGLDGDIDIYLRPAPGGSWDFPFILFAVLSDQASDSMAWIPDAPCSFAAWDEWGQSVRVETTAEGLLVRR